MAIVQSKYIIYFIFIYYNIIFDYTNIKIIINIFRHQMLDIFNLEILLVEPSFGRVSSELMYAGVPVDLVMKITTTKKFLN